MARDSACIGGVGSADDEAEATRAKVLSPSMTTTIRRLLDDRARRGRAARTLGPKPGHPAMRTLPDGSIYLMEVGVFWESVESLANELGPSDP